MASPGDPVPYILASAHGAAAPVIAARPAGVLHVDPLRRDPAAGAFARRIEALAGRAYGAPVPGWTLFDTVEVPGAVIGLARRGEAGLVPVSMIAAVAHLEPHRWHLHTLVADDEAMRSATLALAIARLEPDSVSITCPWLDPALDVVARLAPLRVRAAWTPARGNPDVATLSVTVDRATAATALAAPRTVEAPPLEFDVAAPPVPRAIQRLVEQMGPLRILGAPRRDDGRVLVPFADPAMRPPRPHPPAPGASTPPPSRNPRLLERLRPYLVVAPWNRERFDMRPFGLAIDPAHVFDPTAAASVEFLRRLETLDRLTFGPEGMPMPGWVLYDGAAVTGAILGFSIAAEDLARAQRERLGLPVDVDGLVPLSMWIGLPARRPETWFGHNLASLNRVMPELELHGLASITKATAVRAFRCRHQLGATQWRSAALGIHTQFGPLRLLSAWTPAHSDPATLTYAVEVTDAGLRTALGDPAHPAPAPAADRHLDVDDDAAMHALQDEIESGARWSIVGAPVEVDGRRVVPLGHS